MKPPYLVLCATLLLAPLGLKLGTVPMLHGIEQLGWLHVSEDQSLYRVESIQRGVLSLQATDRSHKQVQLAGLTMGDRWQGQADGVVLMVLNAAGARVRLVHEQNIRSGESRAIIALPNGTLLQEVLLADGLAKLDTQALPSLPQTITDRLQKAEASARAQHKNIWAET
jgi:hypothetical protein